jgi:hypothetical protein
MICTATKTAISCFSELLFHKSFFLCQPVTFDCRNTDDVMQNIST